LLIISSPQVAGVVRVLLQQLKSDAPESVPMLFVDALADAYDAVTEEAEHGGTGGAGSSAAAASSWQRLSTVATRLAGLYTGGRGTSGDD
jgi:hypothetical protein